MAHLQQLSFSVPDTFIVTQVQNQTILTLLTVNRPLPQSEPNNVRSFASKAAKLHHPTGRSDAAKEIIHVVELMKTIASVRHVLGWTFHTTSTKRRKRSLRRRLAEGASYVDMSGVL